MTEIPNLNHHRKNIFGRFFQRRVARRSLLVLAVLMTLATVLYAEEDWRGRRAWEKFKNDMAARGEIFDWAAFIPAPVPDDQNILKAPKIAEWFGDNRTLSQAPLDHPVTNDFARRLHSPDTSREINDAQAAAAYLTWSDSFQDDFDAINDALKRPYARTISGYSQVSSISFVNSATFGEVVRVLEQRVKCHLLIGQVDKAWQEVTLLHDLRRLVETQGEFITTEGDWMVRGLVTHTLAAMARGLELHAWTGAQLLTLQTRLKDTDLLALHVRALRCGRALLASSVESGELARAQRAKSLLISLTPRGAMEKSFANRNDNFQKMIDAFTPSNGIVRPGDVTKASAWWKRALEGTPAMLWDQTLVNEGQIACALERYRLAHGNYPDTLNALVPQFIAKLPRDIINGEPLKYRLTDNGGFLLYSVGWNETDDGGQIVSHPKTHLENLKQNDWVWTKASEME